MISFPQESKTSNRKGVETEVPDHWNTSANWFILSYEPIPTPKIKLATALLPSMCSF